MVGSFPAATAAETLQSCGKGLGANVFCLPDGETGMRWAWVNFLAATTYDTCGDLETVVRPSPVDPSFEGEWRKPSDSWVPQSFLDHWQFKVKEGVSKLRFDKLHYADDARDSYKTFCELRSQGIIPEGVRFQVSLPLSESATRMFLAHSPESFPIVMAAYREAMGRELKSLCEVVPPEDLAVQWDIAVEVIATETGDINPNIGMPWDAPGDPVERYVEEVAALSPLLPEEALLGLHLCYGDIGHQHAIQPKDLSVVIRMANAAVPRAGRQVDFVHFPVPRDRSDDAYFEPLKQLSIGDTKPFIGLVHHTDGLEGTLRRLEVAKKYASGFGLSTECGWGRRKPETIPELMEIINQAAAQL
jgi:hypothetical protein